MMNSFTLIVALATVISVCEGTVDISGIVIRQANTSTAGGFATRATTCSTTQVDCGGGVTQEICCPSNTFCFNSDDGVCCPTGESLHSLFFSNCWLMVVPLFRRRRLHHPSFCCPSSKYLDFGNLLWFLIKCDRVR